MSKIATKRKYFSFDEEVQESEATIAAKEEIQKALSSMLDDVVVECKPSACHVTQTGHVTATDDCNIELFSAKTREDYSKHVVSKPADAPKKKRSSRPTKKKRSGGTESDSSSEEEDLELFASIAVSANDLGTSNSQLGCGTKAS